MTWFSAGYLLKQRLTRAGWKSPHEQYPSAGFPCGPPVEEICSVSRCIAGEPQGWHHVDNRNWHGFLDDPAAAWNCLEDEDRSAFALYFYRLFESRFVAGQMEPWPEPGFETEVVPPSSLFALLGYDAALSDQYALGCSPLSCNGQAGLEYLPPVNRYCLVNTAVEGIELARRFSIDQPEPGAYCAVEVWREMHSLAELASGAD